MKLLNTVLVLVALSSFAAARDGVDFSFFEGELTQENLDCLAQNNKTFAIIEVWKHQWGINKYFVGYYNEVKAMNWSFIDAYAFVCNRCEGNTPQNICTSINNTL